MDFLKEALDALLVDAFGGFQNFEIHANFCRQVNERLNVFWKTEAAVAQPGFEELSANPRVQAHGASDFLDVGAKLFAQVRDDVCIADFEREKGVGGVLDELSAADGGDKKFGFLARRARPVVNRAVKTPIEDGAIDLPEFRGRG